MTSNQLKLCLASTSYFLKFLQEAPTLSYLLFTKHPSLSRYHRLLLSLRNPLPLPCNMASPMLFSFRTSSPISPKPFPERSSSAASFISTFRKANNEIQNEYSGDYDVDNQISNRPRGLQELMEHTDEVLIPPDQPDPENPLLTPNNRKIFELPGNEKYAAYRDVAKSVFRLYVKWTSTELAYSAFSRGTVVHIGDGCFISASHCVANPHPQAFDKYE